LSHYLFSSLGDFGSVPFLALTVIGVLFLIIEAGALYVGVRMTRSITGSVSDLYRATQRVQAQDLSYRIRIARKDQLGELSSSFNSMTESVARAIDEQRRRERLENELAIAHEVQAQLFPRELPRLPGLELAAVCRAARTVSGDFYDFIPIGKSELGIIVADIAGKGISAALLMASLQAALRSQLLENGSGRRSTAEVVQCLNQHLLISSPDDRYATLFFAIYDSASRVLRYTNAGHLPPICFTANGISKLEEGGTVVGLFGDCEYEQGRVTISPGTLLMAYTDGLKEPENAYGEEFGSQRLIDEVMRHRNARLSTIADAVVGAVEDWAGTPERSDDMTVVLASVT
jgi:sigma-B regulation protein RsbU (phosphoserine phosphatase)